MGEKKEWIGDAGAADYPDVTGMREFSGILEGRDGKIYALCAVETDVAINRMRGKAYALWQLLDDISTLDDICRDNDAAFRREAYRLAEKRHGIARSDGYRLYWNI